MQDNNCQSLQQQDNINGMPATSSSSSSRHYVDKARLIQLVHDNPILWDCRLPNYKRADKSKTDQWNSLGSIFNVSGERVQRTFTSLREIFRRELNNEKLLGRRFKSKWEFYKSMSFLRDVIRERKPRERHASKTNRRQQLSPSNSNGIDEYQYFAPNDPNNPSIQQQQQLHATTATVTTTPTTTATPTATTTATIATPTIVTNNENPQTDITLSHNINTNNTNTNINNNNNNSQISVLNLLTQFTNGNVAQTPQQQHQQQQSNTMQPDNDDDDDVDIVQPSPATSTTPSMYIKDEIEIPDDDEDDEDSTSITFNGELLYRNNNNNNNKINLMNSNILNDGEQHRLRCKRRIKFGKANQSWKHIDDVSGVGRNVGGGGSVDEIGIGIDIGVGSGVVGNVKHQKTNDCEELEDDYEDDIDEDDGSSVQSIPNGITNNTINNNNNNVNNNNNKIKMLLTNNLNDETKIGHDLVNEQMSTVTSGGGGGIGGHLTFGSGNMGNSETEVKYRRHLVYSKFADFIVAKMDAMSERDADDLMDRMMLVIAQKH